MPLLPEAARSGLRALREPARTSIRSRPALPISTPADYAAELARATGRFYTPGHARGHEGAEDRRAHRRRVPGAGAHRRRREPAGSTRYVLDRFRDGLLFYYFGNVDQVSHMMWRAMDPQHPAYDAARDAPLRARHRGSLRRPRRGRRRDARTAAAGRSARRDVGPRVHVVAAGVSPEQLAARQRLSRAARSRAGGGPGLLRQRGLVEDARLRASGSTGCTSTSKGARRSGIVDPGDRARADGRDRRRSCSRRSIRRPARRRSRRCTRARRSTRSAGHEDIAPDLDRRLRQGHARLRRVGARRHAAGGHRRQHSIRGAAITAWIPTRAGHSADQPAADEAGAVTADARRGDSRRVRRRRRSRSPRKD